MSPTKKMEATSEQWETHKSKVVEDYQNPVKPLEDPSLCLKKCPKHNLTQYISLTPQERRLRKNEYTKKFRLKRKMEATPEQWEAYKSKIAEQVRRHRQKKREIEESLRRTSLLGDEDQHYRRNLSPLTPEERRQRKYERLKKYRLKQKMESTPEQWEAHKSKIAEQVRRHRQKKREKEESLTGTSLENGQNQVKILDDQGQHYRKCLTHLKPEELRLRKNEQSKQYRINQKIEARPEQRAIQKPVRRCRERKREELIVLKREVPACRNKTIECQPEERLQNEDQVTRNLPIAIEEIKIEKEVLQETILQTIPLLLNTDSVPIVEQEPLQDTSWTAYESLSESFITHGTTKSHFTDEHHFLNSKSLSTKIDRRKGIIEKSLNGLKKLIYAKVESDRFAVFGKYIAQKLSTSTRNVTEVNIAKELIDNVLENLEIGSYSSDVH